MRDGRHRRSPRCASLRGSSPITSFFRTKFMISPIALPPPGHPPPQGVLPIASRAFSCPHQLPTSENDRPMKPPSHASFMTVRNVQHTNSLGRVTVPVCDARAEGRPLLCAQRLDSMGE